MKIMVDIDGTICTITNGDYVSALPFTDRISSLNIIHDMGHEVHYWTARGSTSGKDWTDLTKKQLLQWGVKYTSLSPGKPSYDAWLDDKSSDIDEFLSLATK